MTRTRTLTPLAAACALMVASVASAAAAQDKTTTRNTDERASPTQGVDDAWITTKVKAELAITEGVPSGAITVKTAGGVVTLAGSLSDDGAVKKAVDAARSVKGVKQVDAGGLSATR